MIASIGAIARRRATALFAVLGVSLGLLAGVAYAHATSMHSAGGWDHGIDGTHVFMATNNGTNREGVVAWIYDYYSGVWLRDRHSSETRYRAQHIHVNGCHSWDCDTVAGHISSPSPYLSHHSHPAGH